MALLKIGGDGMDFDWEHLSDNKTMRAPQIKSLATVMNKLRF